MIVALNKADQLRDHTIVAELDLDIPAALVSSKTGHGLDELLILVEAAMVGRLQPIEVHIPYERGELLSLFYERGQVDQEKHTATGVHLHGRIPGRMLPIFESFRPQ